MNISGQSLALLKCARCHLHLSIGPVTCSSDGFFCGRCSSGGKRADIYEALAESFAFPCRYQPFGCQTFVEWGSVQSHEQSCPSKPHSCPAVTSAACQWRGPVRHVLKHFKQAHAAEVMHVNLIEVQLHDDVECCKLLEFNNGCYVFHMHFSTAQKLLKLNVMHLNGTENKDENKYTLTLYSQDFSKKITFASAIAEPYDTVDHSTIKQDNVIEMSVLKFLTMDKPFVYCEIVLNAEERGKKVKNEMFKLLECPVCNECLGSRIFQCQTGHSFCWACTSKLKDCPLCHRELTQTRNYALENLVSQVSHSCKNKELGCAFGGAFEDVKLHEKSCEIYPCPLQRAQNCSWRGGFQELVAHCEDNHIYLESKSGDADESQGLLCSVTATACTVFRLIRYDGVFFRICRRCEDGQLCVVVQFVGPRERAADYLYELGFVTLSNTDTKLTLQDSCQSFTNDQTLFDDAFKVPHSILRLFVRNNKLKCNIKIMKKPNAAVGI